jgi:hypothetical protein
MSESTAVWAAAVFVAVIVRASANWILASDPTLQDLRVQYAH